MLHSGYIELNVTLKICLTGVRVKFIEYNDRDLCNHDFVLTEQNRGYYNYNTINYACNLLY